MMQEAKKPTDQNVKKEVRKGKQGEKSGYAFRPRGKLNGNKLPFLTFDDQS